eukprot:6212672-Pleurochrysis_carterae.AAC.1
MFVDNIGNEYRFWLRVGRLAVTGLLGTPCLLICRGSRPGPCRSAGCCSSIKRNVTEAITLLAWYR